MMDGADLSLPGLATTLGDLDTRLLRAWKLAAQLLHQLRASRVYPGGDDAAIDSGDGQTVHSGLHFLDNVRIGSERRGVVSQAMTNNLDAMLHQPLQVGIELHQVRVHTDAA